MGDVRGFGRERLVVALLSSEPALTGIVAQTLESRFGSPDFSGGEVPFTWTDYYDAEMGPGLVRSFLSFERLVDPSTLAETKLRTNEIERSLAVDGARRVNLDPGLLAPGRFVLATTKDRAHRIPVAHGIFAELTLIYEKGSFHPLPWTYPDWASAGYRDLMGRLRMKLMADLRTAERDSRDTGRIFPSRAQER